jgi:starvation-inducible outer membrane lipoprotein
MRKIVICAIMLVAAGCAKRPEEIKATPIAADAYAQMSCSELTEIKTLKETELVRLGSEQNRAADQDAAWMAIIHVPVASMSGRNKAPEIAQAKGEVQAINSAYQSKNCAGG